MSRHTVVTSFSPAGYAEYGGLFLRTFDKFWPESVALWIYYEREIPAFLPDGRDLVTVDLTLLEEFQTFMAQYGRNPTMIGKIIAARKPFKYDAVKFFRKPLAVFDCARHVTEGHLWWVDADVAFFSTVTIKTLDTLLPNDCYLCCLGRGLEYHPECGWMGFDTQHLSHQEFMERYAGIYLGGRFLREAEWHDSFLFGIVRDEMAAEGKIKWHNLSPTAGRGGHPWLVSPLARFSDHLKGRRKFSGKSWREDMVKMGAELPGDYWEDMPGKYEKSK